MALINGRYEIKETIGEGGMGVVYRAFDFQTQGDVAIKTIKELVGQAYVDLFKRECAVLRKLKHPNVIDLYDYGTYDEDGVQKPFYVMPLLPGVTLDKLIRANATRLTPERVVDIITQTAKGLQAAHDLGLVHRDIKPSNIFVLGDDSVKLIDFGVVHQVDQHTRTGFKGTPLYMSPEQLELAQPTTVSDVFSLAIVCYEALTRRRPFAVGAETDAREAILRTNPPPVSELNHEVSLQLSQVIHAAMAKQPWNRTPSASQFADELQKAFHGQIIERFDPGRIQPRILRAQRALESSQYDFAAEILAELEAEGHIHPEIRTLRLQIDQALRAKSIKQTLDSAQHRFAESEYQLALQKVDEVLRLDPHNDQATALKNEINNKSREQQIEKWFRLAKDHIQNYAFNHARQALQNVLRLNSTDSQAIKMMSEVDRRGNEYLREHREKEQLYNSALDSWHRGEVSVALNKLERVLELDRRAPDSASSESGLSYQNLFNEVRSEHDRIKNAYEEARRLLSQDDFAGASQICEQYLEKFPDHALFQALKFDIGELQRQHVSAYIVKIDRDVEAEVDLNRKVALLNEAQEKYPEESHFRDRLAKVTQRRDLIASITQKIRNLEERGQYAEALGQIEILRAIHPKLPGLDLEMDRITKRRDQQSKADEKSGWVDRIDRAINKGDFSHGLTMLKSALADFPEDPELIALERQAQDGLGRSQEALRFFENAQATIVQGDLKTSVDNLWQAHRLDEHNALILAVLVETLLKRASTELDRDSTLSEQLIRQAIELDPENLQAKSLQQMALDRRKDRSIDMVLLASRELQASGDVDGAVSTIEKGLSAYGQEPRLLARFDALLKLPGTVRRGEEKERDLAELRGIHDRMKSTQDAPTVATMMEVSRAIAGKHPGDRDIESAFKAMEHAIDDRSQKESTPPDEPAVAAKPHQSQTTFPIHTEEPVPDVSAVLPEVHDPPPNLRKPFPTRTLLLAGSLILVIGIIVTAVLQLRHAPPAQPAPFQTEITVTSPIAGAQLFIDEKGQGTLGPTPYKLTLSEGTHSIEARLPGFRYTGPKSLNISRSESAPPEISLTLEPLKTVLRIVTDLQKAFLDSQPLKLDGTSGEIDDGHHLLTFSDPLNGNITLEFDLNAGHVPVVTRFPDSRVLVVAVATLEKSGQVSANSKVLKAGLNESAVQELGEEGLTLSDLKADTLTELHLADNQNPPRTESVDWNSHPSLTILIGSPNAGILNVEESQKVDALVLVKPADNIGASQTKTLMNGKASFRLPPKDYVVTISANGYEPESRKVTIVKGKIADPFATTLKKTITTATLVVTGGTPDAEVYLDNSRIPTRLSSTGEFNIQIPPGKHSIQVRKADYEPGTIVERDFVVGNTVLLTGREVVNLTPFGTLILNITPPNSDITYTIAGEPAVHAKAGDKPRVRQGTYSITASANGYLPSGPVSFRVESGKETNAKIDLKKSDEPKPVAPTSAPVVSKGIESLKGMKAQDAQTYQCQQDPCLIQDRQQGVYKFKIKLSGVLSKGAKWVVSYVDSKNFIEYRIDDKNITYTTSEKGNKKDSKPVAHSIKESNGFYEVAVTISANGITVSGPGGAIPIPSPTSDTGTGTFGFDKNVTIRSDFQFTPAK